MERMVAARLAHIAESRGWLNDNQAGFRRMRCTEDQVLRIVQEASDGFQEKKSKRTVLALLDFSKAFDTVWREKLQCGAKSYCQSCGIPESHLQWSNG